MFEVFSETDTDNTYETGKHRPLGVEVGEVAGLRGESLLDAALLEKEGGVVTDHCPGNVG